MQFTIFWQDVYFSSQLLLFPRPLLNATKSLNLFFSKRGFVLQVLSYTYKKTSIGFQKEIKKFNQNFDPFSSHDFFPAPLPKSVRKLVYNACQQYRVYTKIIANFGAINFNFHKMSDFIFLLNFFMPRLFSYQRT